MVLLHFLHARQSLGCGVREPPSDFHAIEKRRYINHVTSGASSSSSSVNISPGIILVLASFELIE